LSLPRSTAENRVRAAQLVSQFSADMRIIRAVVYAHPHGLGAVDFVAAILPGHHFLEWSWPHTGYAERKAFDFDGILCEDIAHEDCDDGPRSARSKSQSHTACLDAGHSSHFHRS